MTRGIIAELFTPEQAKRHAGLVRSHLLFPDGVRLEDRPVVYHGGPSRTFRRAETAANFGREVGLGYMHAHIRYVEAMAKLGRPDAAFDGLLRACPILLDRDVPASLPRQSNSYFSSSDAAFTDRWQAQRRFGWIRSGRVGLKGGWRVYSSGPGIFLNQLISNVLGLRRSYDDMVFDPVLPRRADGLTYDVDVDDRPVRYLFHVTGAGFSPRQVLVNGRPLPGGRYAPNPYRAGGLLVEMRAFRDALDPATNLVEIFIQRRGSRAPATGVHANERPDVRPRICRGGVHRGGWGREARRAARRLRAPRGGDRWRRRRGRGGRRGGRDRRRAGRGGRRGSPWRRGRRRGRRGRPGAQGS
jgi:1,2-beta-oligoglucan phosphorylase